MTTACRLTVHGRVQGVWYRNWTVQAARDLALTGWVRNRKDGTVEIHAEGDADAIDRLIELAAAGPPAANVERIECDAADCQSFDVFEKRR
ncbi:acylphosphatase [Novosphingopyxis iocasae]|uniref:acylphosphatase n=1 Tax=Novosphingopyxis iocasae TaxID=2762729 RepID=UPI001650D576|nr:acylphosphatase [Novosphingopyxis iocasae]